MNDISGFSSPKGEPLPNDDLDLQLVWLGIMRGMDGIPADWKEYIGDKIVPVVLAG